MSIEVSNESGYQVDEAEIVALSRHVLDALHVHPQVEMSVLLVDVDAMSALHVQWMDIEGPTDVLSFPMDELRPPNDDEDPPAGLLGDIVLCPAVTARQAQEHGRTAEAEAEYLLVHGLLHLLGFDHAEPDEKTEMFALKDTILARWASERPDPAAAGVRR
jgi:probable rRNA maturation factor